MSRAIETDRIPLGTALRAAAAIFLVALCMRGGYFAVRGVSIDYDSTAYLTIARNIATYGAYSLAEAPPLAPTIRRAPVYPAMLAVIGATDVGTAWRAVLVQLILDALSAAGLVLLACHTVPLRWAVGAGAVYALHPGAIDMSTHVLTEPLFTFLSLLVAFGLAHGIRDRRLLYTALGGLALGVSILCRPIGIPLVVLLPLAVGLVTRPPKLVLHCALFAAAAAVVVAPWSVRASEAAGSFVLVQGHSAANFYVPTRWDWNQADQAQLWVNLRDKDEWGKIQAVARTPREAVEADRIGMRAALANIRANPAAYAVSRLKTYPYLFLTSFDHFTGIHASFAQLTAQGRLVPLATKALLLLLFALAPLVLAVVGAVGSLRSPGSAVAAALWIYTALIHIPMWIEYRFWLPAVPFMLVSSAVGAVALSRRFGYAPRLPDGAS
jgi:4-amino-4-deoxy-L-arabinose transferase-like glycosyltransferase